MIRIREFFRSIILAIRYFILTKIYGMRISKSARISYGAILDKSNPKGIVIGDETYVTSGALIMAHDYCRLLKADTVVGKRCFIGANAIILCGIHIGDNCIVGAGSVVTKDVPSGCIVVGNPAHIIKEGIMTKKYGVIIRN